MNMLDLMQEQKEAFDRAEAITKKPNFNATDQEAYDSAMARAQALGGQIRESRAKSTLTNLIGGNFSALIPGGVRGAAKDSQKPMSEGYNGAFLAFLRSGGKQVSSELSEGFDPLFGGFALPS